MTTPICTGSHDVGRLGGMRRKLGARDMLRSRSIMNNMLLINPAARLLTFRWLDLVLPWSQVLSLRVRGRVDEMRPGGRF